MKDEKFQNQDKHEHDENVAYGITEKGYKYLQALANGEVNSLEEFLEKEKEKKPLGYLGGDIMTFGSKLARQYEYKKFKEANIPGEVYSPIRNDSINNKSAMTEEENNQLAEKIVEADVERLWNSDYTVLCPEQSAIGTMCEMSILYAWKYMAERLLQRIQEEWEKSSVVMPNAFTTQYIYDILKDELKRIKGKKNYAHYFDIRTNHLNEKDWRRSFSINQFLYGVILAATTDNTLHNSFDEILPILKKEFPNESEE